MPLLPKRPWRFGSASNNERAGATTDTLVDARCLYLPVAAKNTVYGVCGILMNDADSNDDFGAFEKNLLLMIVGECGQAAEQIVSAEERRAMEVKVEKETLRSNLLRTISHDLRTPLTSISGDADMLLMDGEAWERAQRERLYRDIHDDAQWLIALVENLLSITRIDNGTVEINRQPELVADVVREALAHIDRRAGEGRVQVDVADELLMADMDARLIIQVVVNLVNNALSYSPPEGRVVVTARARPRGGCGVRARGGDRRRSGPFRRGPPTHLRPVLQWIHRQTERQERRLQARHGTGLAAEPLHRGGARRAA